MYMQTYYNCSGPPRSKEKHKKKKKVRLNCTVRTINIILTLYDARSSMIHSNPTFASNNTRRGSLFQNIFVNVLNIYVNRLYILRSRFSYTEIKRAQRYVCKLTMSTSPNYKFAFEFFFSSSN